MVQRPTITTAATGAIQNPNSILQPLRLWSLSGPARPTRDADEVAVRLRLLASVLTAILLTVGAAWHESELGILLALARRNGLSAAGSTKRRSASSLPDQIVAGVCQVVGGMYR